MSIRILSFDLDDTFWDLAPTLEHAETHSFAWLAERVPVLADRYDIQRLRQRKAQVAQQQPALAERISALRIATLEVVLLELGVPAHQAQSLAQATFEEFLHARHQLTLFAEVEAVLEELGRHFRLGVLTNGNADVRRLPIAHHFEVIVAAEELGISKPDPRLFHAFCQRASVTPNQVVHIGDHPHHDALGALKAGMQAVWLNRTANPWPERPETIAEIRSLDQLPALLGLASR